MSRGRYRDGKCRRGHELDVVGTYEDGGCIECAKLRAKRWTHQNRDKSREIKAGWKRRNPDTVRRHARSAYWRDPDKLRARSRDYIKAHPHINREAARRRMARKRAARAGVTIEAVTRAALEAMLERQEGRCFYCKDMLEKKHLDHMTPLSRGGKHSMDNLCWTCPSCNLRKHRRTAEEFVSASLNQ